MSEVVKKIEEGCCLCGCGKKTTIAKVTDRYKNKFKGKPMRFVVSHNSRYNPGHTVLENGCWRWNGHIRSNGYSGPCYYKGIRNISAHRVYFMRSKGEIPKGMQLDHLCRNRFCVNPDHLEAVTHTENRHRGVGLKLNAINANEIRVLYKSGVKKKALSEKFMVSKTSIRNVLCGATWK